MELLAYIQEESVCDDQVIATTDHMSTNANMESTFQSWLKKLTTKSVKLSLNVILASTTLLIGLGSTLNAIAEVTPSSDVKYVQSLLAKNGFDPGAIDGVAGTSTKNAIIRAQQALGLTPDGVAGSRTIAALENGAPVAKVEAKASETEPTSASAPSSSVMNLQKLLADRGFYNGAVDGIMGNQTRSAIIAAQKAYNLTPDGVAGAQTLAALESDGNKTATTPISASTTSTTTSTTKSTEVANLQELLSKRGFYNGAVDGIMGNQTRNAIIAAQKNYGLAADGIAGSKTIAALESGSSQVNIAAQNTTTAKDTKDTSAKASDSNVASVQQLLAKRGFYNGAIDGIKGNQTKAAIVAAQNAYGLTPDGIAGAQTVAALQKDTTVTSATKITSQATTQAAKSSATTDENVANLQNLLTDRGFYSGPITGFLGPRTKAAIIAAQKAYGLNADGIAGAQTIAALESGSPRQQQIAVNNTPTVRVQPQVVTPQATPQPQLQPKIQVQPQTTPQATPQAKTTPPATQATPQATAQPQATVAPQVQPTPATPIATATVTPAPQASANNAQVVELQNLLAKRGFYNGKADGVLNAETRNAIVRAQNFYTITPADGSPSNKLIDSLNKDSFISEGN